MPLMERFYSLHRLGPELITAFEQASITWHMLFQLKSIGKGKGKGNAATATASNRQEAS
jgi:hypothetical protein